MKHILAIAKNIPAIIPGFPTTVNAPKDAKPYDFARIKEIAIKKAKFLWKVICQAFPNSISRIIRPPKLIPTVEANIKSIAKDLGFNILNTFLIVPKKMTFSYHTILLMALITAFIGAKVILVSIPQPNTDVPSGNFSST